jgi:hypothetical protein
MKEARIESLPLYPEERECRAPTTRRMIDLFENIQFHELKTARKASPVSFATELSGLQREVLRLLRISDSDYQV